MARHLFKDRAKQAKAEGFCLERDRMDDHPYCLWYNAKQGSVEIWIKNLAEEFDWAFSDLMAQKEYDKN